MLDIELLLRSLDLMHCCDARVLFFGRHRRLKAKLDFAILQLFTAQLFVSIVSVDVQFSDCVTCPILH